MKSDFDVVVIGASFAGCSFVRNLIQHGPWRVLLIDSKRSIGNTVESTGLITEHTRQLFGQFFDIDRYITNRITTIGVITTNFEDHFFSDTKTPWIYQTDTRSFIQALSDIQSDSVTIRPGTVYLGNTPRDGDGVFTVTLRQNGNQEEVRTKCLIGADGGSSRVAQVNALERNRKFLFGIEEVYFGCVHLGPRPNETIFHFWFGEFSLGYGGWLSSTVLDGKNAFRIGLGKRLNEHRDARELLHHFRDILATKGIITIERPADERYGVYGSKIPIGGPLKRTFAPGVLLIGDAAGYCGAFAADGIKGSVISAIEGSKIVDQFLRDGRTTTEIFRQLPQRMNQHHRVMDYYRRQVFYRFVWDRMRSNRSFKLMYDIIHSEKDGFLQQFCDSKERGRGLTSILLKPRHIPKLFLYTLSLFLDLWKPLRATNVSRNAPSDKNIEPKSD